MAEEEYDDEIDGVENIDNSIVLDLESPLYRDLASRIHPDLTGEEETMPLMMVRITLVSQDFGFFPIKGGILIVVDSANGNHEPLFDYLIKSFGVEEVKPDRLEYFADRFIYYPISLTRESDGSDATSAEISELCGEFALDIAKEIAAAEKGMTLEEYEAYMDSTMEEIRRNVGEEGEDEEA